MDMKMYVDMMSRMTNSDKEEFAKELIDKSPDLAEEISGLIKYKLFENTIGENNGEKHGRRRKLN